MNVTFTAEDLEFRAEVRKYFETEFPQDILDMQNKSIPLSREDVVRWHKHIYEKGWAAANWPTEYGGTGWTPVQKYIFADEQARANAPVFLTFGVGMVGPVKSKSSDSCPIFLNSIPGGARATRSPALARTSRR